MKRFSKIGLVLAIIAGGVASSVEAQLLTETFSYPDGPLVTRPGSPWTTSSGTANQQDVISGRLFLDDNETEDTVALFSSAVTSGTLLASFTLENSTADLPSSSTGQYITHFVDSSGNFVGRVFTLTNPGGAAGTFRIGIATTAGAPTSIFSIAFTAGTTYTLNLTYDFTTNAASLSSPGFGTIVATDTFDSTGINRYGFRQVTTSAGDQFFDNLSVSVVPEPSVYMLLAVGLLFCGQRFMRRKSA